MGPSLATASGLEGRLRPGFLDCKGDPPGGRGQEAAGVSHSPLGAQLTPLELRPEHY